MRKKQHRYEVDVRWAGNTGQGTRSYRSYDRAHEIRAPGKAVIDGSSDPAFLGDPARWNPEELLVASVSACHKLWYLHLCAVAGVVVTEYEDRAVSQHDAAHAQCFIARSVNFPITHDPQIRLEE